MRCRLLLACARFVPLALSSTPTLAQHSVARQWNEALLETIGRDHADPTIQARNLFHTSIAPVRCLGGVWRRPRCGAKP